MAQEWNIDWLHTPLLGVLEPALARVHWPAAGWPGLADYQGLLDGLPQPPMTAAGARLRVVPQAASASQWEAGYEPRIYLTGELQTRSENWHDLLNLLVWASFPRTKAALNQRHYELQQARAVEAKAGHAQTKQPRSPAQDALTQFDESGVIVACSEPELAGLLRAFHWKELFWHRREAVRTNMACYLFGHGLMEKALAPYRGMSGKGFVVPVPSSFFSSAMDERVSFLDRAVADLVIDAERLACPADLAPVPVLGFPGFTPDNEAESYYDDRDYFRPGRRAAAK